MSLQEQINKLCPDGVPYKRLSDVCDNIFAGGTPNTAKSEYYDGDIPWIRSGEVDFNFICSAERNISQAGYDNSSAKWIRKNSVVMAMTGATVAKSAVVEFATTANQSVAALEPSDEMDYKFLYYYISSQYTKIKGMAQGALTSLNLQIIKSITVPVPPIAVQKQIVSVLDNFTKLTAELSSELEARKKQFEYYRDNLLCFNELSRGGQNRGLEWLPLGTVCYYPRERVPGSLLNENTYLSTENMLANKKGKIPALSSPLESCIAFKEDDILIGNIRPYLRKIWFADCKGGTNGDVLLIRRKEEYESIINARYLFYILSSEDFFNYDNSYARGAKMPRGDRTKVLDYQIPIPSIIRQDEIVSILDSFDCLLNSVAVGIPAEISARQQQFEYYRDKLLTFKRKEVA